MKEKNTAKTGRRHKMLLLKPCNRRHASAPNSPNKAAIAGSKVYAKQFRKIAPRNNHLEPNFFANGPATILETT